MEREDPLERIERERAGKKQGGPLKSTMIIMAVIAVALAVALAYVLATKNKLVGELNLEKAELTQQVQSLQADYESLSSDYDVINAQLDSSREEVAQLIEKVRKTDATNRSRIRQYERELGTLRSIMRGYIVQIDSLNKLNHKLTVEAATARREAAEHKKRNEELTAQVEDLSGRVATGSVIKGRGLSASSFTSADKITDKSTKVSYLLVNLSLIANDLAEKGPVRVFLRVTSPDGTLLLDGKNDSFEYEGSTLMASASREIDYQGSEVDVAIYVKNAGLYTKGVYTVTAYLGSSVIGTTELYLR